MTDMLKIIENMAMRVERDFAERILIPFDVWTARSATEINFPEYKMNWEAEFGVKTRMNFGVTLLDPRNVLLTNAVDDSPRPPRMPFEVFAALEVLWIRIDLDLFDRRLTHLISEEIT